MDAVDESSGTAAPRSRPYSSVAKGYTFFREGDVLFAKITPCMQNGKSAIATGLIDDIGFGTTEFHVIRPSEALLAEWLLLHLRNKQVLKAAEQAFTGAVGQQRVPAEFIANLEIPLPALSEQHRIIAALADRRAVVNELCMRLQGQATDAAKLATGGIAMLIGPGVRLPSDVVVAPHTWRWRSLTEVAKLESGHTPSRKRADWWGGDIPWLALPDIRRAHGETIQDTSEHTNEDGLVNSSARLLPAGTVCLSRTASVGFSTILGRPMATSQDFVNWVCGPELEPAFLLAALVNSSDYLRSIAEGAIHKTVYVPAAKALQVCMPDLKQQRAALAALDARRQLLANVSKGLRDQLAEANQLDASLLCAAFSGQL